MIDVMELVEIYLSQPGHSLDGLAEAAGVSARYLCEARAGKHRLSPPVAAKLGSEFRRVGLLPEGEISQLRFELACRNADLGAIRRRAAALHSGV